MRKLLLVSAFLLIAIAVAYGGGGAPTPATTFGAPEPLKIGVLVPFTGDVRGEGRPMENAARLAAQEINATGGVLDEDIEIVTGDTASDPSQGVTEATRLIEVEGVHVILGAVASGVTLAIAESVTGPSNVLQISPASTSPALTTSNDNDFLFRTVMSDAAQGVVLAQLAQDLGFTSVCTMFINDVYGQGLSEVFAKHFEATGGSVLAQVPHESGQPTYASELAQCTAGGPDALAAISYTLIASVFLREAADGALVDNYLFVDGTKSAGMFASLGWDAFDGMRGTAPGFPGLAAGSAFDAAYEAEFGVTQPSVFIRQMYDAVYLVALAAEQAGSTDPRAIRNALRDIANPPGVTINPGTDGFARALELVRDGQNINYEGASGPIYFDENGDTLIGAIEVWRVDAATEDLITERVVRVDLTSPAPAAVPPGGGEPPSASGSGFPLTWAVVAAVALALGGFGYLAVRRLRR